VGLLFPDADTNVIVDVLKHIDAVFIEATAEIASGCRIGNTARADGVQEVDVVTAQLDVLQTIAVAQRVVSEVEHLIGFVVRQAHLENLELPIDSVNKANASGQEMKRTNAAIGNGMHALGDFVLDIAGGEHRFGAIAEFRFVESPLDLALAGGQLIA